jgi:hypothetical protein
MIGETREPLAMDGLDGGETRGRFGRLQQVERGQRGRAAKGIGGEGMAMREGALEIAAEERLVDLLPADGRGQRQEAAGQALGQTDEIGRHAGLEAGEGGARAAEAGHHLVEDEQDAGSLEAIGDGADEVGPAQAHAAGTLDQRLHDERDAVAAMAGDPAIEHGEADRLFLFGFGIAVPRLRIRQQVDGEQKIVEGLVEAGAAAGRHGAEGIAVIAALEGQEAVAPRLALVAPVLIGELEGHLDAGRAVVGVEDALQSRGQQRRYPGRHLDRGLVGEAGEDDLFELRSLVGDGCGDGGVGVAVQGDPPGRDEVEVFAAVGGDEARALGAADGDRIGRGCGLREGVPDMAAIERQQVVGLRHRTISGSGGMRAVRRSIAPLSSGSMRGSSASTHSCPKRSMAARLPEFGGPLRTTPAIGSARARSAARLSSV